MHRQEGAARGCLPYAFCPQLMRKSVRIRFDQKQCLVVKLRILRFLIIEESPLETIEPSLFGPFPALKQFQIAARISAIASDAFTSVEMLTHLSVDNNRLNAIPKAALRPLRSLETLSISNNRLRALVNGDEFLNLAHLRSLSLSGNSIHTLHPATFASLGELRSLNASWNHLASLDAKVFQSLAQLEVLDLSYNYLSERNPATYLHGLKALRELNLGGNLFATLRGSTFGALRTLERLDLSDNFLKSLPTRIFTTNRKLTELNLDGNLLETIPVDVFVGLDGLHVLNLRYNRLTHLAQGTFRDQPLFTELSLEGNRIDAFGATVLKSSDVMLQNNRLPALGKVSPVNATAIRNLFLYGNEIRSIEQDAFEVLVRLEAVYLDHNHIEELSPMLFHTNHHLHHVTLAHNRLTVLRTNTFAGLRRLHSVDLSSNRLAVIEPATFHGSPVEYLNLNGNRLKTLDDWALSGTQLLYLHVDSNAIASPLSVQTLDRLMELSAANNHITDELCTALRGGNFSQLTAINLANNSLTAVGSSGCLDHLTSNANSDPVTASVAFNSLTAVPVLAAGRRLHSLDLSGNALVDLSFQGYETTSVLSLRETSLRELRAESFAFLQHPTTLAVSSSVLETVEEQTFHGLKLERVELNDSPLRTLPASLLKGQTSLRVISLSNNELSTLPSEFFAECTLLEELDLSKNALDVPDPAWFLGLERLKSIDLQANGITQLPSDLLSPEHTIEVLSLAANALDSLSGAVFLADVPIRTLNLSTNRLAAIDILHRNDFITRLDVSGNRLKRLLLRPNYRVLIANANRLTSLDWEETDPAASFTLEHLELADNQLHQLDPRLFRVRSISTIDASENRLDDVPFAVLHRAKLLTTLIVSRNNIRTLPQEGVPLFKLALLDLAENPLEELPEPFLQSCVVTNLIVHVAK
uniref:Chaoptin n=1 Tax=Anopheles farauti TaxID=69004 RepID=A0A182Q8H4_9DIPT